MLPRSREVARSVALVCTMTTAAFAPLAGLAVAQTAPGAVLDPDFRVLADVWVDGEPVDALSGGEVGRVAVRAMRASTLEALDFNNATVELRFWNGTGWTVAWRGTGGLDAYGTANWPMDLTSWEFPPFSELALNATVWSDDGTAYGTSETPLAGLPLHARLTTFVERHSTDPTVPILAPETVWPGAPLLFESVFTANGRGVPGLEAFVKIERLNATNDLLVEETILDGAPLVSDGAGVAPFAFFVPWSFPAGESLRATVWWEHGDWSDARSVTHRVQPFANGFAWLEGRKGPHYPVYSALVGEGLTAHAQVCTEGRAGALYPCDNATFGVSGVEVRFHIEHRAEYGAPWTPVATFDPVMTDPGGHASLSFGVPHGWPVGPGSEMRVFFEASKDGFTFNSTSASQGAPSFDYRRWRLHVDAEKAAPDGHPNDLFLAGSTVTLQGNVSDASGPFGPGRVLSVWGLPPDFSAPVHFGNATTNATGNFTLDWIVPADAPLGDWDVEVRVPEGNASSYADSAYYAFFVDAPGGRDYKVVWWRGEEMLDYFDPVYPGETLFAEMWSHGTYQHAWWRPWNPPTFEAENLSLNLTDFMGTDFGNASATTIEGAPVADPYNPAFLIQQQYANFTIPVGPGGFDGATIYGTLHNGTLDAVDTSYFEYDTTPFFVWLANARSAGAPRTSFLVGENATVRATLPDYSPYGGLGATTVRHVAPLDWYDAAPGFGVETTPLLRESAVDLSDGSGDFTIPADLPWWPNENGRDMSTGMATLFDEGNATFGTSLDAQAYWGLLTAAGLPTFRPEATYYAPMRFAAEPGATFNARWQAVDHDGVGPMPGANLSIPGLHVDFFLVRSGGASYSPTTHDEGMQDLRGERVAMRSGADSWWTWLGDGVTGDTGAIERTLAIPREIPWSGVSHSGSSAYRLVAVATSEDGRFDRTFERTGFFVRPPVTLGREGEIAGRVTDDATGAPIPGAEVLARGPLGELRRAMTNETGGYLIDHARVGPWALAARHPSFFEERARTNVTLAATTIVSLALTARPPQSAVLRGVVGDGFGGALAGMNVVQMAETEFGLYANETTTGEDGSFTLRSHAGNFTVFVGAGVPNGFDAQVFNATLAEDGTTWLFANLSHATAAQLSANVTLDSWESGVFASTGVHYEDAFAVRYLLDCFGGNCNSTVEPGEGADLLDRVMREILDLPYDAGPLRVDGRPDVGDVGEAGLVALEGPVDAAPFGSYTVGDLAIDPVPEEAQRHRIAFPLPYDSPAYDVNATVTVPLGFTIVNATHTANVTSFLLAPDTIYLEPLLGVGGEVVLIDAQFGGILVRVRDHTNRSLAIDDALVAIGGTMNATGEVDEDGTFTLPNPPSGWYSITVTREGYRDGYAEVDFTLGSIVDLVVPLERWGAIAGVVRDGATGGRVPYADVLVVDNDTGHHSGSSDAFGRFFFGDGIPDGPANVTIERDGYASTTFGIDFPRNTTSFFELLVDASLPDYVVDEMWTSPEDPVAGEPAYLYANVTNRGTGPAGWGSYVAAFAADGSYLGTSYTPALDVNETITLYVGYLSPARAGNETVRVAADAWGAIRELDETNNALVENVTFAAPPPTDLRWSYVYTSWSQLVRGEVGHVYLYGLVQNDGGAVGPFESDARLDDGTLVGTADSYGIGAGGSSWVAYAAEVDATSLPAGLLNITLDADVGDDWPETNESNNTIVVQVPVVEFSMWKNPAYPDVLLSSSSAYIDQPFNLYAYYGANASAAAIANVTMEAGLELEYGSDRSTPIRTYQSDYNWFSWWAVAETPGSYWVNLTIQSHGITLSWNETIFVGVPLVEVKTFDHHSASAPWATNLSYRIFDHASFDVFNDTNSLEIVMEGGSEGRIVTGLDALLHFPYGCVEQTTTGTRASYFAQLYYFERDALTAARNSTLRGFVNGGLERLQTGERAPVSDGGWNQWSVDSQGAETFFTLYPTSLLLKARDHPYGWYAANVSDGILVNATRWIVNNQSADGGWEKKDYGYISTNVTLTAMALEDLALANASFGDVWAGYTGGNLTQARLDASIQDALDYLVAAQAPSGGWGLAPYAASAPESPNAYTTARAIIGMAPLVDSRPDVAAAVSAGASWLASNQNADGSWDSNPEHSHWMWGRSAIAESTAYGILALNLTSSGGVMRNNTNNASIQSAFQYLLRAFEPGPGWGSNKATGTVIEALTLMRTVPLDARVELILDSATGAKTKFGPFNLTNAAPSAALRFEHQLDGRARYVESGSLHEGLLAPGNHTIWAFVNGTGHVGIRDATSQWVPLDEAQADPAIVPFIDPIATNFTVTASTPTGIVKGQPFTVTVDFRNLAAAPLQTPMVVVNLGDAFTFVSTSQAGVTGYTLVRPDRYGFNLRNSTVADTIWGEYNTSTKKLYLFPDFLSGSATHRYRFDVVPQSFGSQTLEIVATMMYDLTTIWPYNATFSVLGKGTIDLATAGADSYTVDGSAASGAVEAVEGVHWVNATKAGTTGATLRMRVTPSTTSAVKFAPKTAADLFAPRVVAYVSAVSPTLGAPTVSGATTTVTASGNGQATVRVPLYHNQSVASVTVNGAPTSAWLAGSSGGASYVDVYVEIAGAATIAVTRSIPRAGVDGVLAAAASATHASDPNLDASIDITRVHALESGGVRTFAFTVRGAVNVSKTYRVDLDTNGDRVADKYVAASLLGSGVYTAAGALLSTNVDFAFAGGTIEIAVANGVLDAAGAAVRFRTIGSEDATDWLTANAGATAIAWTAPAPSQGAPIPMTVTVKNFGAVPTGPLAIALFVDGFNAGAAAGTLASLDPGATGTATVTWTAIQGTFALAARVTGATVNQSATLATIAVAGVDAVKPTISSNAPTGATTSARPAISASWSDAASGISTALAQVKLDGAVVAPTLTTTGFTFTPTTDLALGAHSVNVTVGDLAGNLQWLNWSFTRVAASSGGGGGGGGTGGSSTGGRAFNISASEATVDRIEALLGIPLASGFRGVDADGDGDLDTLEDPSRQLRLVQNSTTIDGRSQFLVGRVGRPGVAFLWDTVRDFVREVSNPVPTVAPPAFDPASGRETLTVTVDKGEWIYFEIDDPNPRAPLVEVRAADGRVMSADRVWRVGGKIAVLDDPDTTYTVTLAAADATKPVVAFASPAAGATLTEPARVIVTATDDRAVTSVSLFAGATLVGTDATSPYEFNVDPADFAVGPLALRAVATDSSGNEGEATRSVTVARPAGVDLSPPETPPETPVTPPPPTSPAVTTPPPTGAPTAAPAGDGGAEGGGLSTGMIVLLVVVVVALLGAGAFVFRKK